MDTLKEIINLNLENLDKVLVNIDSNQSLLKEILEDEKVSSHEKEVLEELILTYFNHTKLGINEIIEFWRITKDSLGGISLADYIARFSQNQSEFLKDLRKIGVNILSKKNSKPIGLLKVNKAITNKNWIKIALNLKGNEDLQQIKPQLNKFIVKIRNENFKKKIVKIKKNYPEITNEAIEEYKLKYLEDNLSFDEFWMDYLAKTETNKNSTIPKKSKTTQTRKSIENSNNFDDYEAYLNANERDLARMKRKGVYGIKKTSRRVKKNRNQRE